MPRQTEFEFTLPVGYTDQEGKVHRQGVMRMATAMDEIAPLRDLRVRGNQAYLAVILLSRVITRLGALPMISTAVIENLYVADAGQPNTGHHSRRCPKFAKPFRCHTSGSSFCAVRRSRR